VVTEVIVMQVWSLKSSGQEVMSGEVTEVRLTKKVTRDQLRSMSPNQHFKGRKCPQRSLEVN
jgi:hypothetical protein